VAWVSWAASVSSVASKARTSHRVIGLSDLFGDNWHALHHREFKDCRMWKKTRRPILKNPKLSNRRQRILIRRARLEVAWVAPRLP